MQYNCSFGANGFSNYRSTQPYYNPQIPFNNGLFPEVVGEGEVVSVLFPDGSVQFYFIPSFYRFGNQNAPYTSPIYGSWFVRSIANPIPLPVFPYGIKTDNNNIPTTEFQLKFHYDKRTSTTDIHYFYPALAAYNCSYQVAPEQIYVSQQKHTNGCFLRPCTCVAPEIEKAKCMSEELHKIKENITDMECCFQENKKSFQCLRDSDTSDNRQNADKENFMAMNNLRRTSNKNNPNTVKKTNKDRRIMVGENNKDADNGNEFSCRFCDKSYVKDEPGKTSFTKRDDDMKNIEQQTRLHKIKSGFKNSEDLKADKEIKETAEFCGPCGHCSIRNQENNNHPICKSRENVQRDSLYNDKNDSRHCIVDKDLCHNSNASLKLNKKTVEIDKAVDQQMKDLTVPRETEKCFATKSKHEMVQSNETTIRKEHITTAASNTSGLNKINKSKPELWRPKTPFAQKVVRPTDSNQNTTICTCGSSCSIVNCTERSIQTS